jgi:LysM repeat protein
MLVGARSRRPVSSRIPSSIAPIALIATSVAIAAAPVSAAGFSCDSAGPTYAVRSGDGWFTIANRVDVSARALLDANDATVDDLLLTGDRLCLPPGADVSEACATTYAVRSGDGWLTIAGRAGVSASALLGANGADLERTIHPGDVLCLPEGAKPVEPGAGSSSGSTYTIVRGDSWYGLAARAGVSARALLTVNGASANDLIVPGDVIRLPAGAKQPTRSASSQRVDLDALPLQAPCGYSDTWGAARGGGRRHIGTDMFVGSRDYVYAVVDGKLTSRNWAHPGSRSGNSWTLTAPDGTYFFYAHLSDFNPALRVGSRVQAGEIIGWVGSTGNASAPHLHFEVHPGGGEAVNPYPILRAAGGCNAGRPYTQPGGWVPT